MSPNADLTLESSDSPLRYVSGYFCRHGRTHSCRHAHGLKNLLLALAASLTVLAPLPAAAQATDWPAHPITFTTAREKAIVQASIALTQTPDGFDAARIRALKEAGLTPTEILDLVHSVALFAWANRLMLNLGEPQVMPA